ncbi:Smr/MutS family protein [Streptomyces albus]
MKQALNGHRIHGNGKGRQRAPACRGAVESLEIAAAPWLCQHDVPRAERTIALPAKELPVLSLDLHPIFRNNRDIDRSVRAFLFKAYSSGESKAEIIPGKGRGQLRQHVLAYLNQRHMKRFYKRVETDSSNSGRIIVHFK